MSLKHRSTLPEKMDDLSAPEGQVRRALAEIETINRWLGGYRVVTEALEQLSWPHEAKEVRLLDIGSGGGDTLRAIARWAQKKGLAMRLTGIDINPAMTRYASKRTASHPNVHFRTASVFDADLDREAPHIVTCNLLAHHFDGPALAQLLSRLDALATDAVIINDLHRHPVAYHSIKMLTRLFSRTYLVKYDAPLSVARALTRREWQQALRAAGINSYTMRWRWAWRWEIIIAK